MAGLKRTLLAFAAVAGAVVAAWALLRDDAAALSPLANPGPLSEAHTSMASNCLACHTPHRGVEDAKCILCHANAISILQRQPTAFHADIGQCAACHREHRHPPARLSHMDHGLLAKAGLKQLDSAGPRTESAAAAERVAHWLASRQAQAALPPSGPGITPLERTLNCATCHRNDDRHFQLFGTDCAACHGTGKWTIPEFRHPPASSRDCAQCHQAPPSHYMMHFHMISATVAGQPHAKVNQCHLCHQTTAWPDIKGRGWYKHH